ncbi:MAG: IS5 family transposase [Moorea sp. SIO4A1]|uniref:IS5 family transposase n=1 Tax=Moorena sp. SIO4A1 TaxID=2607835 RepID=UPI00144F0BF5|nr:IS5 family transposase [Moorena sp. SIO4A1]NEQ62842.1 IS5 family transposase [Moorena sp. SIO4A1]
MYRKVDSAPSQPEDFELPFEGKLSQNNRWVIMANLVPWSEFEEEYAKNFAVEMGAPALPFRIALGALIIKEKLGISDRETVEQIKENPYLQYLIGRSTYSNEAPFDPSLLVKFRERITANLVNRVNEKMVGEVLKKNENESSNDNSGKEREEKNRGQLLSDATAAPGDIRYPNDLGLLNQARVASEKIIDNLYETVREKVNKKPKTYRNLAQKDYLKVAKQRRPRKKERRKAIKKQLQYIKRNLSHIEQLIQAGARLEPLSNREYKSLLVIAEVYRQQQWMYDNKTQRIDSRIVNLSQPHIRPIVRGKAGTPVEFGAKLSVSCIDGYVFLDRISWDNFNESGDLKNQIEAFKYRTGVYPESVHVDKIYRTRSNRAFCKERGIRISGPPLGRPKANISAEKKKQAKEDEIIRNGIEGKFGVSKRRFSLNRVMAKLPHTSQTAIAITFLVMNLSALLRQFFCIFSCFKPNNTFLGNKLLLNVIIMGLVTNKHSSLLQA